MGGGTLKNNTMTLNTTSDKKSKEEIELIKAMKVPEKTKESIEFERKRQEEDERIKEDKRIEGIKELKRHGETLECDECNKYMGMTNGDMNCSTVVCWECIKSAFK